MNIISTNIVSTLRGLAVSENTVLVTAARPTESDERGPFVGKPKEKRFKKCAACGRLLETDSFDPEDLGMLGTICRECKELDRGRFCPRCGLIKPKDRFTPQGICRDCRSGYYTKYKKNRKQGKERAPLSLS